MNRAEALAFALILTLRSSIAQASSSDELLAEGTRSEATGAEDHALAVYFRALEINPSCEQCYLALGALRLKRGEFLESERVYSVALARVPSFSQAFWERARSRLRRKDYAGAITDTFQFVDRKSGEGALAEAERALIDLRAALEADGRLPSSLLVTRRLADLRGTAGQSTGEIGHERTLVLLLGTLDPIVVPLRPDRDRLSLARIVRIALTP